MAISWVIGSEISLSWREERERSEEDAIRGQTCGETPLKEYLSNKTRFTIILLCHIAPLCHATRMELFLSSLHDAARHVAGITWWDKATQGNSVYCEPILEQKATSA